MYNIKLSTVYGSRISIQCTHKIVVWFTDNEVKIAPLLAPGEQHLIVSEENPSKTETYNLSLFVISISNIRQLIIS